jgi:serine/threonine-protein kinase HipA
MMATCTIEIWTNMQWKECCTVEIDQPSTGGFGSSMLDYEHNYVFEQSPACVSIPLPPQLNFYSFPTWPAFLFDLIPQGKGRHYLLGELELKDGPSADWPLLCAGAFNPIGRLRIKEAVQFYAAHTSRQKNTNVQLGFSLEDILNRHEDFIEQLYVHSMLSAGTSGVQGVAPKFLLTLGKDNLWYADGAISDELAQQHFIVKLPRGTDTTDFKILKNEAAYMRTAKAIGLFVNEASTLHHDMLFIPRFDRSVRKRGVERFHQESGASLVGQIGYDQRPTQNELLAALRRYTNDKLASTIEFLKRDVLNLALGNTDNHARNTAVQIIDKRVQLTPLFDFAPMYMDKEGIARVLRWRDKNKVELTDWSSILSSLELSENEHVSIRTALREFANGIEQLPEIMRQQAVDDDVIERRYYSIQTQLTQLRGL